MQLGRRDHDVPTSDREEFVAYQCGPLRGICVRGYEVLDLTAIPWDDLKASSDPNHELTKSSRTRRVVRLEFAPSGQPPRVVYAKRVLVADWRKRIGRLFAPSKARREWTAGYRLMDMGLATARPVVCAELWQGPWLRANFLVTEEIADARPLRAELEYLGSGRERRHVLGQVGEWLWQVHCRGFYHDDCSTQHIFVRPTSLAPVEGRQQFWFIDLDNCRFHRATVPWRRRIKNLFQLLRSIPPRRLSRTDRLRFLQAYLNVSGEAHRLRRAIARMRRLARAKKADISF